jgi:DNA-directed RNA polymerase specialized sigma24 family protein
MATLPARDRAAIALRHALELDPEQIAVVTRAPAARCAARLRDARDRLQEMLEGSQPIGVIEEITDGH